MPRCGAVAGHHSITKCYKIIEDGDGEQVVEEPGREQEQKGTGKQLPNRGRPGVRLVHPQHVHCNWSHPLTAGAAGGIPLPCIAHCDLEPPILAAAIFIWHPEVMTYVSHTWHLFTCAPLLTGSAWC